MSVSTDTNTMTEVCESRDPPMEPIEIKPSTELIKDEYEHTDGKKDVVHIFIGNKTADRANLEKLKSTFNDSNYLVETHDIDTKNNVENKLDELANKDYNDISRFVIIFLGRTKEEMVGCICPENSQNEPIEIRNIWSKFIACKSLKNKPKVFIFQAVYEPSKVKTDSVRKNDSKYDAPIEADLFIAYKLIKYENANKFITAICKNIKEVGKRDDILDIITHTDACDRRPLIISTLTRKFYVTANKERGHYHDFVNHVQKSTAALDDVETKISKLHKNGKRPENIPIIQEPIDTNNASTSTNVNELPKSPIFKSNKSSKNGSYTELNNPKEPRKRSVSISTTPSQLPQTTTPIRPRANSKGKDARPIWRI